MKNRGVLRILVSSQRKLGLVRLSLIRPDLLVIIGYGETDLGKRVAFTFALVLQFSVPWLFKHLELDSLLKGAAIPRLFDIF